MRSRRLGEYQTVTVTRGSITQAVTATGTLNPVVNVQVGSQISGNIEKLLVDFNSPVKAGQVVAQIDPAVFQAAVLQAQGDLDNAKAALEFAQVTQKRMVELVEKQNSSQSELDQANGDPSSGPGQREDQGGRPRKKPRSTSSIAPSLRRSTASSFPEVSTLGKPWLQA